MAANGAMSALSNDFSHFVWIGSPDIKTALSKTKKMYSDPLFAEFSNKVSGIRKCSEWYG